MRIARNCWASRRQTVAAAGGMVLLSLQTGCLALLQNRGAGVATPEGWRPPTTAPGETAPAAHRGTPQRNLRPGDRVIVTLRPSLSAGEQMVEDFVDDKGMITLPLIGEFSVAELSPSAASRAVAAEYVARGLYLDMVANLVNMTGQEAAVDEYSVTGEVRQRGRFPLREGLTLWQAIIAAGDVGEFASDRVLLTRDGVTKTYCLNRIKRGRVADPAIRHGDIIEVRTRGWFFN